METINKIYKWIRTDGLLHIETSALIFLVVAKAFSLVFPLFRIGAFALATTVTFLSGIAKEQWDAESGKGTAEMHDLLCDLFGLALGMLIWV